MRKFLSSHYYSWLLPSALSLLLCSCATTPRPSTSIATPNVVSAQSYLDQAAQSQDVATAQHYRILALNRYIQERKFNQAHFLLKDIKSQLLTSEQMSSLTLASAELALAQQQYDKALRLLQAVSANNAMLSSADQLTLHRLLADAYANKREIDASLNERNQAISFCSDSTCRLQQASRAWQLLQTQTVAQLQALAQADASPNNRGWVVLAQVARQSSADYNVFASGIRNWKHQYPQHPANALLPSSLSNQPILRQTPNKVAVLLPQTGPLKSTAAAIQAGILAAYYQAKQTNQPTPQLAFYDTASRPVAAVYREAVKAGADFILGPLTKDDIRQLIEQRAVLVPTVALNSVSNPASLSNTPAIPNNLYQLSLSPLDEAVQLAEQARQEGHNQLALITAADPHSQEIAEVFNRQWQQLGGKTIAELSYDNPRGLTTGIQRLLTIDLSQQRASQLERLLSTRLRFMPRRRQDLDALFVVANPVDGSQIKPLLRYYFAGDLPLYATSSIYKPYASRANHDLDGVLLTDMPWVLYTDAELNPSLKQLRDNIRQQYPQRYSQFSKLYALGIDAYQIIPQLNKLALLPNLTDSAAIGQLMLDKDHHLFRRLALAQLYSGRPILVDAPA